MNPENDPRYRDYWGTYHQIMARRGVTPDVARAVMRRNEPDIPEEHFEGAVGLWAAKRTVVIVEPEKVITWDHSKLGGVY